MVVDIIFVRIRSIGWSPRIVIVKGVYKGRRLVFMLMNQIGSWIVVRLYLESVLVEHPSSSQRLTYDLCKVRVALWAF